MQDPAAFLGLDPVQHRQGGGDPVNQHNLGAKVAASLYPVGIGRLRHHHLRRHACRLCRPGERQREIAARKPGDAALPLRIVKPVNAKAGPARLERTSMLEQLKLDEELGIIGDIGGDLAATQRHRRGADHSPGKGLAGSGNPVIIEISHGATLAIGSRSRQSAKAHTSHTTRNPWCAAVESGEMPERAAIR